MNEESSGNVPLLAVKHIRILRIFLNLFGAWPGEIIGEKITVFMTVMRKLPPLETLFFILGQVNYISVKLHSLEFFEVGDLFVTLFLAIITLMYFKVNKVSEYFAKVVMCMTVSGLTLYNLGPIYYNYSKGAYSNDKSKNVTIQFTVYYMFPGFQQTDHVLISTIINFFLSWNCSVSLCAIDAFLCLMVIQIIAHIKILSYNIQYISDNCSTCGKFTDEENNVLHKRIKDCVEHHRVIIEFVHAMSGFFGPLLGLNYAFHLVGCCLLLLECSTLSVAALIHYGPITIVIFSQLIMISVTFEVVNSESDKLSDVVYATPWERMDIRNQVSMCIILRRIQEPLQVTAMGLTEVSVRTMASILKATFSYFAFLHSLGN